MMNTTNNYRNIVEQSQFNTRTLGERLAMEGRNLEQQARIQAANNAAMVDAARQNANAMIQALMRQEGLVREEQSRQQQYARGQRDVLDANVGLFGDFGGQMDESANSITSAIMELINSSEAPTEGVPQATGIAANREAAMRDVARGEVTEDVGRRANMQAFDDVMQGIGFDQGRNNQIGSLLANFAQGSASVLDPALQHAGMWFQQNPVQQTYVPQERYIERPFFGNTSRTGDFLQMFSQVGQAGGLGDYLNGMFKPSPYDLSRGNTGLGLKPTGIPNLESMGGGSGLRLSGNTGMVLNSNLGLK